MLKPCKIVAVTSELSIEPFHHPFSNTSIAAQEARRDGLGNHRCARPSQTLLRSVWFEDVGCCQEVGCHSALWSHPIHFKIVFLTPPAYRIDRFTRK